MKYLLLLAGLMLSAFISAPYALEDRVVAVVNDQIITESAVRARAVLLQRQMGLENTTPQQREALAKRTLATMIDEELQRQYATRLGISVSEAEVKRVVADIAAKDPSFEAKTQGIETAAGEQISTELLWNNVMAQILRPQVEISNAEVDKIIEDMLKSQHVLEREISQIFMAVDEANEAPVRSRMEQLLQQLHNGEDFSALARLHSEEPTSAAQGGNMGWFASGELNPQLEDALGQLETGQISGLIRTPLGFHILRLENTRSTKAVDTSPITEVHLVMVARPLPEGEAEIEALSAITQEVVRTYETPQDVRQAMADEAFRSRYPASTDLGWVTQSGLQSAVQQATQNLEVGNWTPPLNFNGNVGALYLLGTRQVISPQLTAYRERVRNHLLQNRLELAARGLMRELRQRAFVDIRW